MKTILVYLLIACSVISIVRSQGIEQPLFHNTQKALTVGDRLPHAQFDKVLQHGQVKPYALGMHQTPLLIIDFWTTRCRFCVQTMPKLDSLCKLFPKDLSVLMSTYEDEGTVMKFKSKNPLIRDLDLPIIMEDSFLGATFEHISIPHLVWIYRDTVIAITGTDYVKEKNIKMVLSGKKPDWPIKKEIKNYDYSQSLLKTDADKLFPGSRISYSALTGYMDGIPSRMGIQTDSVNHTKRGYLINLPVINAYFILLMKFQDISKLRRPHLFLTGNQVVVENDGREKYWFEPEKSGYQAAWRRENDICLEVVLPDDGQDDIVIYRYMLKELDRLLGIHGRFENREVDCWVVKNLDTKSNIKQDTATHGQPITDLFKQTPLSNFIYRLNLLKDIPPVFNESNYEGELVAAESNTDIHLLNRYIKKYNLQIVQEKKRIDQLVITASK